MTCTEPIPLDRLTDWWTGDLAADEAAEVEEHVFACDTCAARCEQLGGLVGALRAFLPPVISRERFVRLGAAGKRIRLTTVAPGERARARFAPELDLLVHALKLDLARADRVDVEVLAPAQQEVIVTLENAPFDREAGEVLIACQRHYEELHRRYGGDDATFRVHVWERGAPARVEEFIVDHEWT